MGDRADFDYMAWDRNDLAWEESQKYYRTLSTLRKMELFVSKKFGKAATWVKPLHIGGYNNLYKMRIEEFPGYCSTGYQVRIPVQILILGQPSTFRFVEDDWSAQSQAKGHITTLSSAPSGVGCFRIWCDDFRPSNILLNEKDDIVAIIDWEFAYTAPTQFALDPPWWLLLNVPECWETGRFWLNYAARKSWAFDTIFWKYLDHRLFGSRKDLTQQDSARQEGLTEQKHVTEQSLWKTRVHLLSDKERNAMEAFVERKMEEGKQRMLIDDLDDKAVRERLRQVVGEMLGKEQLDLSAG
ncbi:hypothetical protein B0O99DRAFT_705955 [Bisporella sp. PMI_857]|nr:hypothetical protein B0O99DRAFT_705955 [Bisporella sp. PMI_857]